MRFASDRTAKWKVVFLTLDIMYGTPVAAPGRFTHRMTAAHRAGTYEENVSVFCSDIPNGKGIAVALVHEPIRNRACSAANALFVERNSRTDDSGAGVAFDIYTSPNEGLLFTRGVRFVSYLVSRDASQVVGVANRAMSDTIRFDACTTAWMSMYAIKR